MNVASSAGSDAGMLQSLEFLDDVPIDKIVCLEHPHGARIGRHVYDRDARHPRPANHNCGFTAIKSCRHPVDQRSRLNHR